jgi:nitrogen-specific signal transduction histidine kinase
LAAISASVAALVARLSGRGVVVLDSSQRCVHADPRACELLGAADVSEACFRWEALRRALDVDSRSDIAGPRGPLRRRVDVDQAGERRSLRIELHALDEGTIALVHDARHYDSLDRLFLLAGEAQARKPALSGLAHRAKGPLNNFHLTLALLAATLERGDAGANEALLARSRRRIEVLQAETQRLVECVDEIGAHAIRPSVERVDVDVDTTVTSVIRILRHEATLRDVVLAFDKAEDDVRVVFDTREFELALVGFVTTVLATTAAGGTLRIATRVADASARISITGAPASMPAGLADAVFGGSPVDALPYCGAVAGRIIVEACEGAVALVSLTSGWGFDVAVPLARS